MVLHLLTKTCISYMYTDFLLVSREEWSKGWSLFERCPHWSPKVSKGEEIETGHAGARVASKHPPPGAVDGHLDQAWGGRWPRLFCILRW